MDARWMPDMSTELLKEEALNLIRTTRVGFVMGIETDHEPGTEPGIAILSFGNDALPELDEHEYELAARIMMAMMMGMQFLKGSNG